MKRDSDEPNGKMGEEVIRCIRNDVRANEEGRLENWMWENRKWCEMTRFHSTPYYKRHSLTFFTDRHFFYCPHIIARGSLSPFCKKIQLQLLIHQLNCPFFTHLISPLAFVLLFIFILKIIVETAITTKFFLVNWLN